MGWEMVGEEQLGEGGRWDVCNSLNNKDILEILEEKNLYIIASNFQDKEKSI